MKRQVLAVHLGCALAALCLQNVYAESIPLKPSGGILVLPVVINSRITLDFVLDSGAADVSIPLDVFSTLRRTGTISEGDLLPATTYTLADGSVHRQMRFRIQSLKVGSLELRGVVGSVSPPQGELLLGQSFLRRLRSWSIDNQLGVLIINEPPATTSEPVSTTNAPSHPVRTTVRSVPPDTSSRTGVPRWERCTAAQIRNDDCREEAQSRAPAPSNDEPETEGPPPRWERCTPAQIRNGECR